MAKNISIAFTLLLMLGGACCTSDDQMCIASAADTGEGPDSESAPTEAGADCCAAHGNVDGYDNICAVSKAPVCVGCDGKPVLCMTTGCGVPFVDDCCLVDGATVTCQR